MGCGPWGHKESDMTEQLTLWASQDGAVVKNPPAGDMSLIPGLERSPGEGNGNPLLYSCLENPMDRGAWWATVHRVSFFFNFYFIFKLYKIVLVLPNIKMNPKSQT